MVAAKRLTTALLLTPLFLWFLFLVVGPTFVLIKLSLSTRGLYGEVIPDFSLEAFKLLADPLYARTALQTVAYAVANTITTVVIAFPMAFWISRLRAPYRTWALTLVLVPFWTSFLVRLIAFMDVLRLQPFEFLGLYTHGGLLAALVYNYLPCAVLPLYASLEKIDQSVIDAAADLGAGRFSLVTKILIPLSKGGIVAAALFVFVPTLGEFLTPELIGGTNQFLLGSFLENQFMSARNWPLGAAAIVVILGLTLLLLTSAHLFGGRLIKARAKS